MKVNVTFSESNDGFGLELENESSLINDKAVSTDSTWSSKNIIDSLCPAFTKSGAVVTCEPVEGYPLAVTAEEGATITRCGKNLFDYKKWIAYCNESYTGNVAKEEVEYLGEKCFKFALYRTNTSLYYTKIKFKPNTQYTFKFRVAGALHGAESTQLMPVVTIGYGGSDYKEVSPAIVYRDKFVEYTFTSAANKSILSLFTINYSASGVVYIPVDSFVIQEGTTAEYQPYLGGTFVEGEQIPALNGINNLWADSGLLTVSGKADPVARLERLENAILAMGANV